MSYAKQVRERPPDEARLLRVGDAVYLDPVTRDVYVDEGGWHRVLPEPAPERRFP